MTDTKLMLCMNCCQVAAYNERSGVSEGDPEPLRLIASDRYVVVLMDKLDEVDDSFGPACDGCGTVGMPRYPALAVAKEA